MRYIYFEALCGVHLFSGCELTVEDITNDFGETEHCDVCLFVLDGITYKAVEDQEDGFRSYCKEIKIVEQKPRYSFPPIAVVCSMLEDSVDENNDILVIRDAKNGKTILEVGTKNTDDWYPYCWFKYTPENMSCNEYISSVKYKAEQAKQEGKQIGLIDVDGHNFPNL